MVSSAQKRKRQKVVPLKRRSYLPAIITVGVLAIMFGAFWLLLPPQHTSAAVHTADAHPTYVVGDPGPGTPAPPFSLESTDGKTVQLSDYRGKSVLLFFHEGIGCQPCWDQIRDLDKATAKLRAAGIDDLLTITSGPVNLIAQKMNDDKLTAIGLADTKMDVIRQYGADKYGMMGDSRAGHSFILVGPDGTIHWRGDYGGAPNYTMYVSVADLLADIKTGRTS
ncbi:MAG TPA: peroxiredoxin family protein [Lacisediminihabitans sp.]|uniref:peroxiredoxin family protein n=1 Tax=Lacisediminihabitans sp. TaxID=2787631 RepID=UPI002ED82D62